MSFYISVPAGTTIFFFSSVDFSSTVEKKGYSGLAPGKKVMYIEENAQAI